MTTVILSAPRISTSGLAPVLSMIIRFWISVDSLKRPPTLLTIASSFRSSCISLSCSGPGPVERLGDPVVELPDGLLAVVVDNDVLVLAFVLQFVAGGHQPPLQGLLRLRPALTYPRLVQLPPRQLDEDRHMVGVQRPHLR